MKLFTSLALCSFAHAADVSCMESNADDAKIQMTATVLESEVERDLTEDGFSLAGGVYTKVWTADQFTSDDMSVDDSGDLVLIKSVSKSCVQTNVDGVDVCIATGHNLEFKCVYGLGTKTVKSTFDVSGHDTIDTAEGTGKLNYNLVVDDANVDIGETVIVTISPVNEIGIWARLQDCQVTYNSVPVSILDWVPADNEIKPVCDLTAHVDDGISQKDLTFSWSAFKWATQTDQPETETQEISCEISLSKDEPAYQVDGCVSTQEEETPAGPVSSKPTFYDVVVPDQKTLPYEVSWKTCTPVNISGFSGKACASSYDAREGFQPRDVTAAFDGDIDTIWHSCWTGVFDNLACTKTDESTFLITFDEPQMVKDVFLKKRNDPQQSGRANGAYRNVCMETWDLDEAKDYTYLCTEYKDGDATDADVYLANGGMDIVFDLRSTKKIREIRFSWSENAGIVAEFGVNGSYNPPEL